MTFAGSDQAEVHGRRSAVLGAASLTSLPTIGKLVELDPALLVTPPLGLEVGYVHIVTRQAAKE